MTRTVLEGGAVVAMDDTGAEYRDGHVVVDDGRITAVGPGSAPPQDVPATRVDLGGCLVTPGLVNTHHHLYQWATRGLAADAGLYAWLTTLYPAWARMDEWTVHAAASAGLARLARSGCTTVADHHYLFPRAGGDVFGAVVRAAERLGTRLHAVRGSMDRGQRHGGLPPDDVVEDRDAALAATAEAVDRWHDPSDDAAVRVAVGPCSPFTVTSELMRQAAELARRRGVRLHTHLAETEDEHHQCAREHGCSPAEYADALGWLGADTWVAHGVHLTADGVQRLAAAGTGVAHCPSSNARLGAGSASVRELLRTGVPVGLGVDGAASNEDGGLVRELPQALFTARVRGGPRALGVREVLWMATRGGARCLGRDAELGALAPGMLADLAVWRLDGLDHAGISDPVAALVLGPPPAVELLLRGGETIVQHGATSTVGERELAHDLSRACARTTDWEVGHDRQGSR